MAKLPDKYAQFFYMSVTMSAANTLTFAKLGVGVSLFDYAAFLLERIEYQPTRAAVQEIQAQTDEMVIAITGSDGIASLEGDKPEVYDKLTMSGHLIGAAANLDTNILPIVHHFTSLPGGGLLVPAQDLFIAMQTTGFANAQGSECRVYYTVIELQATDFLELVQRLRVLST